VLAAFVIRATSKPCEESVNFYQTTRRNNPEDSHLHIRRRENLKSHCLCTVTTDFVSRKADTQNAFSGPGAILRY
jgi:hypothetical protein